MHVIFIINFNIAHFLFINFKYEHAPYLGRTSLHLPDLLDLYWGTLEFFKPKLVWSKGFSIWPPNLFRSKTLASILRWKPNWNSWIEQEWSEKNLWNFRRKFNLFGRINPPSPWLNLRRPETRIPMYSRFWNESTSTWIQGKFEKKNPEIFQYMWGFFCGFFGTIFLPARYFLCNI